MRNRSNAVIVATVAAVALAGVWLAMRLQGPAAAQAAPYVHCRLSATATVNASANSSCGPLQLTILSVPRGAQIVDGQIVWPDGTPATAEETAFRPYKPTPALPALTDQSAAVEPLEVIEPEPDGKVEVLDVWRRRSGGDDGPGAV